MTLPSAIRRTAASSSAARLAAAATATLFAAVVPLAALAAGPGGGPVADAVTPAVTPAVAAAVTPAVTAAVAGPCEGPATAARSTSARAPSALAQVVAALEQRYEGEVVAIQHDTAGDKPAHYHVDMRFPSGLARVDVDAATLALAGREDDVLPGHWATLADAIAVAAAVVPGRVVAAELDTSYGADAHYDVDVRLERGDIARLRIDAATRQIGWRTPAIL